MTRGCYTRGGATTSCEKNLGGWRFLATVNHEALTHASAIVSEIVLGIGRNSL